MDGELNIGDYISIVKRRFLWFLIPFVLLVAMAIPVIVLLPPVYVSEGIILIESPRISRDIISGSVDGAARERIEVIKQRVMTRNNLLRIAEKFNVIEQTEGKKILSSSVVNQMRNLTTVEFISSGRSRRTQTTIAFKVGFQHRHPLVTARVANELVTLFVNENVSSRIKIANETTQFLNQEAEKLERQLKQVELQIATYKQDNAEALPENLGLRLSQKERLEAQIRDVDREIKSLQEESRFLDIQLRMAQQNFAQQQQQNQQSAQPAAGGQIPALPPVTQVPELANFIRLKGQLEAAKLQYSDAHPDIRALKRQLEAETLALEAAGGRSALWLQFAKAQDKKQDAVGNGQDSQESENELTRLTGLLVASYQTAPVPVTNSSPVPDLSQVTIGLENIQTKIAVVREREESLRQQSKELQTRLLDIEEAIVSTPQIDRGLRELERDYLNAQKKYAEIRDKAMQAQIAENVEEANKSERFVLVEPPTVPDIPAKPNRIQLLAMAFALAAGVGAAALVGIEFIDGSIRNPDALAVLTQAMPLAVVPYIETNHELVKKKKQRLLLGLIAVLLGITGLVLVHFFYMPFDVLLYKIQQRF